MFSSILHNATIARLCCKSARHCRSSNDTLCCSAEGAQSGSPYQQQPLSTLEANPFEGKSGKKPSAEVQRDYFKLRLMECIAGLDRGFAANSYAAMQVESAALALTEQSQPVMLSWTAGNVCI